MRSSHSTRAKVRDKAKARQSELREERQRVKTKLGTWPNVILREPEREKPEPAKTSLRPEIKGTEETWAETRRKCIPAKCPDPEVIPASRNASSVAGLCQPQSGSGGAHAAGVLAMTSSPSRTFASFQCNVSTLQRITQPRPLLLTFSQRSHGGTLQEWTCPPDSRSGC